MFKSTVLSFLLAALLCSCNLYGGLDSPSGDAQLLMAARAALDSGDYVKAKAYYQQLSTSFNDTRVSELSFTILAQNKIFMMSDLLDSLGDSRGGPSSFIIMANLLASRGVLNGAARVIAQTEYVNSNAINSSPLRSFMKFIAAMAMFNEVLANAVGSDNVLTASDLATTPTTCKAAGLAGCAAAASCANPATNTLGDDTGSEPTTLDTATNWSGAASTTKLAVAASDASSNIGGFASTGQSGILSSISLLAGLAGQVGTDRCIREQLLEILFP